MDAFELLKKDHKKVSQLFQQIESASGQGKHQLFAQVKAELDVHAHIEEAIFYPALENTEEARDITLEAYEEHKVVKDLLGELAQGGTPEDEWDAKFKVLKENVEHHVEEEEGELFDKAEEALEDEQIEKLGNEMAAEKARRTGAGGAPARSPRGSKRSAAAASKSPGVIKRLANLVGLGGSSSQADKKSGKKGSKSAGTKSAAKARATKSSKKKVATKSAKKAGTKGSNKASKGGRGSKQASSTKRGGGRAAKKR